MDTPIGNSLLSTTTLQISDELFWTWLAGFSDGEACFHLAKTGRSVISARFSLGLRCDDWRVLQFAQVRSDLGSLRFGRNAGRPNAQASVKWEVRTIEECGALANGLRGRLLSKKARDFAMWDKAQALIFEHGGGIHSPAWPQLNDLMAELQAVKRFSEDASIGSAQFTGKTRSGAHDLAAPRTGRSSHAFWASEGSRPQRQWRQLKYAKLTQGQVDEIVRRVAAGERRGLLAKEFDISYGLISKFVSGKYLRRDGTLEPVENEAGPKPTDPAFWKSEAGQRAHRNQAAARGKLTQTQIDELVARYKDGGVTTYQLAEEYGVSRPLISKFIKGNYIRRD